MEEKHNEIFEMLVEDFDHPKFLRELSQRMPIIYSESESRSFSDELVSEPFKKYYFGHSRYTLSQSVFYAVANETGIECKIERCESNGFPIAIVSVGRFRFTLHYGQTPNEVTCLNTSLIRKQHTAINNEMLQPSLFGNPSFDKIKLSEAENIYANIIHGCRGKADSFNEYGFLSIGIPCLKKNRNGSETFLYVENINLFDVLQRLIDRDNDRQTENQSQPMPNIAMPKIKKVG